MATARHKETEKEHGARADAVASLRKLRNKIVHVTVSDPENRAETFAEFELPLSDFFMSALDDSLKAEPKSSSREPNDRLAAALEEATHIVPRFKSAQELFDALEKEGQA